MNKTDDKLKSRLSVQLSKKFFQYITRNTQINYSDKKDTDRIQALLNSDLILNLVHSIEMT